MGGSLQERVLSHFDEVLIFLYGSLELRCLGLELWVTRNRAVLWKYGSIFIDALFRFFVSLTLYAILSPLGSLSYVAILRPPGSFFGMLFSPLRLVRHRCVAFPC